MKTIMNFTCTAFGIAILAISTATTNSAPGNLFVSVNAPSGSIYKYTPPGVQSTFASGLPRPRGMDFDQAGNLFVATIDCDVFCQAGVVKIAPNGTESDFATISGSGAGLGGSGLAIERSGNVFLMVQNLDDPNLASTIFKFTPNGTQSTFALLPSQSYDLAFDSTGNLFAADAGSQTVYRFTPDGTATIFVGPAAFGPNQFPVGLAFDRFGNLFVSTEGTAGSPPLDVIFKFTPQGLESTFATGVNNPRGMAFDAAGNLFVALTAEPPPGGILKFTPDGRRTTFASGFNQQSRGPEYLTIQPPRRGPPPQP